MNHLQLTISVFKLNVFKRIADKNPRFFIFACAGLFVALQALSWLAFQKPIVSSVALAIAFTALVVIAFRDIGAALLIIFVELFIGSSGRMFIINLFGSVISLRMALFAGLCAGALADFAATGAWQKIKERLRDLPYFFWPAILVVFFGITNAFTRGISPSEIFLDANNYLFLILFIPAAMTRVSRRWRELFFKIFAASLVFLAIKALAYFLSAGIWTPWYGWERTIFLSQITLLSGYLTRIFFWSELYAAIGFIVCGFVYWFGDAEERAWSWFGFIASAALLTMAASRSFWVAVVIGFCAAIVIFILEKFPFGFASRDVIGKTLAVIIVVVIILVAIGAILKPYRHAGFEKNLFSAADAGIANRRAQFKPLLFGIAEHPIFGSGFGRSLEYQSVDPREAGLIRVSAFELGYLDMILKLGIIGAGVLLYFFGSIVANALKNFGALDRIAAAFTIGAFVLFAVHIVSPYLQHPLGIGYLVMVWMLTRK